MFFIYLSYCLLFPSLYFYNTIPSRLSLYLRRVIYAGNFFEGESEEGTTYSFSLAFLRSFHVFRRARPQLSCLYFFSRNSISFSSCNGYNTNQYNVRRQPDEHHALQRNIVFSICELPHCLVLQLRFN